MKSRQHWLVLKKTRQSEALRAVVHLLQLLTHFMSAHRIQATQDIKGYKYSDFIINKILFSFLNIEKCQVLRFTNLPEEEGCGD